MRRDIIAKHLCCLTLFTLLGGQACAATLSPLVSPLVSGPGADNLSAKTMLGFPGSFWLINLIDWEETEEISIQAALTGPTTPELNTLFVTIENSTSAVWNQLEIEVNQPSAFSATIPAPPSINTTAPATIDVTANKITFTNVAIEPDGFTPTISFGIFAAGDQPLSLTFRPTAVPEPTSGLLLGCGLLALTRRRRKV